MYSTKAQQYRTSFASATPDVPEAAPLVPSPPAAAAAASLASCWSLSAASSSETLPQSPVRLCHTRTRKKQTNKDSGSSSISNGNIVALTIHNLDEEHAHTHTPCGQQLAFGPGDDRRVAQRRGKNYLPWVRVNRIKNNHGNNRDTHTHTQKHLPLGRPQKARELIHIFKSCTTRRS